MILFFIIFASTATSLLQRIDSSSPSVNYDITTLLNNSVARTLLNPNADAIRELIGNMRSENPIDEKVEIDYNLEPFVNKLFFTDVRISIIAFQSVHIRHAFSSFEVTIFIPTIDIRIAGCLETTNGTIYASFVRSLIFKDISIFAFKHYFLESEVDIHMNYSKHFKSDFMHSTCFHKNINTEIKFRLERIIEKTMPLLFLHNLKHNEIFLRSLKTFCNHPEKQIASIYPDFENNTERFLYFIPKISSLQRTLRNITILGLWNFQSHSSSVHLGQITTNLMIKNIRGQANLSYDSQNLTIFPLRFEAGFISILVDEGKQRVAVTAHNYSVSQINLNSTLTEHQSKWAMGGIELAIASSLMPSFMINRIRSESSNALKEHPIVKISTTMSQQFERKTIQKLYDDWNISIPENITAESNLEFESSIYNISVYNSPNQTLISNPYPNRIQCNLYDTLKINFGFSSYLFGKIRLSNSTHKVDDIDFTIRDIFGGFIKRNNSNENHSFEFLTVPKIDVHQLSAPDDLNFLKAIIEKTKQMVISSISEVIMQLVKPLLSLPLDYCTAPVKLFDDFLPFSIDEELSYHVPDYDNKLKTEHIFTSHINNVVIEDWTKTPNIKVLYQSANNVDGNIESIVNTELGMTKVRMDFINGSVRFDHLEFVFREAILQNFTDKGEIAMHFRYDHKNFFLGNNLSLSANESYWFKSKLEDIIAESFKIITKIE